MDIYSVYNIYTYTATISHLLGYYVTVYVEIDHNIMSAEVIDMGQDGQNAFSIIACIIMVVMGIE